MKPVARIAFLAFLTLSGCAAPSSDEASNDTQAMTNEGSPVTPVGWQLWLKKHYPAWYVTSPRTDADTRPWLLGFDPATDPVFAHNETFIEGASPTSVLGVMRDADGWRTFYPNSGRALERDTGAPVRELDLGTRYFWTTFGVLQDMHVAELVVDDSESVLAWTGGSLGTEVYHRWMFRAEAGGTRVVTEEIERGVAPDLDHGLMSPSLHAGHQLWLDNLKTLVQGG
jgi:hypothetical protein